MLKVAFIDLPPRDRAPCGDDLQLKTQIREKEHKTRIDRH